MQTDDKRLGYQGAIPPEGAFFDRVDVEGESHSRTYFVNGHRIVDILAHPDPERPGKWQVGLRWHRREKWLTHGWGPLDGERDALAMMDAVGIGVEAVTGGCTYLGNL